jgi:hypothetical protein
MMHRDWANAAQTAETLGVHVNTLKRMPPEQLPFFRVTNRGDRRYRWADIHDYIESRMVYYSVPSRNAATPLQEWEKNRV